MKVFEYGNLAADRILIQMVDDHDLEFIEREVDAIARGDFRLIAIQVGDWNKDLSPWKGLFPATPLRVPPGLPCNRLRPISGTSRARPPGRGSRS